MYRNRRHTILNRIREADDNDNDIKYKLSDLNLF